MFRKGSNFGPPQGPRPKPPPNPPPKTKQTLTAYAHVSEDGDVVLCLYTNRNKAERVRQKRGGQLWVLKQVM